MKCSLFEGTQAGIGWHKDFTTVVLDCDGELLWMELGWNGVGFLLHIQI